MKYADRDKKMGEGEKDLFCALYGMFCDGANLKLDVVSIEVSSIISGFL